MSFIEDNIKELKDNPRFKDYDITLDNYNYFLMMSQEDKVNGDNNPIPGFYHEVLKNSNGRYEFTLIPCDSKKNAIKNSRREELINTTYFTKKSLDADLSDFRLDTIPRKKAYEYAKKFIKEYSKDNYMDGLYLHGRYGTGKTYLLSSIANMLADKGLEVYILFFPDLCRDLKRNMFKEESEELINKLKNVDILMIDDLGAENLTGYIRDDVLGPILNYRWVQKLPIFIATNLSQRDIKKHLSQTKEDQYNATVDQVKGDRIVERILNSVVDCDFDLNA